MDIHLTTYGNRIHINNGMFCIIKGEEKQKIPVKDVKAIYINRSAGITADTLFTAIENGIDVVFSGRSGRSIGRVWSAQYGSISTIRKKQLSYSQSDASVKWILSNLALKAKNQQTLLYWFDVPDGATGLNAALRKMARLALRYKKIIPVQNAETFSKIRGIEGVISRIYFQEISKNLPTLYHFQARSQHPAKDMFNALLNYAYGILYGKIEGELIRAGLDPYVGIFHRDDYNKPVLVYDVIERFRMWADAVVVNLCMQHVIFEDFFEVSEKAWCLNDFGKKILITAFTDFLDEVVEHNSESASRITHIKKYCVSLATHLKQDKMDLLCSI